VVGVFLAVGGRRDKTALDPLDEALAGVRRKDSATIVFNYTVGVNLPRNQENFYRYDGSLTTPGCEEAVLWTVFAEPIAVTEEQVISLGLFLYIDSNNYHVYNKSYLNYMNSPEYINEKILLI
jgi:carbonic anhydrase